MRQIVRYRALTIPAKMYIDVRISIDDRGAEFTSTTNAGDKSTSLSLSPIANLSIFRANETDENNNRVRAPWNRNDHLNMTKHTIAIVYNEMNGILQDIKKPKLYTYQGNRLELNETLAEEIRRVFMIGNMAVELSAVVIVQPDESRIEGIKIKFNNEQSSVSLTLNEMTSLVYNLGRLDMDVICLLMYQTFITRPKNSITSGETNVDFPLPPAIDIIPKK